MKTRRGPKKWTPEEKLALVLGSYEATNLSEYCREKGIDRSYLYQLRKDLEESALSAWRSRKTGRPRKEARSVEELEGRVAELEAGRASLLDEMRRWQTRAEVGEFVMGLFEGVVREELAKKKGFGRGSRRR